MQRFRFRLYFDVYSTRTERKLSVQKEEAWIYMQTDVWTSVFFLQALLLRALTFKCVRQFWWEEAQLTVSVEMLGTINMWVGQLKKSD